MNRPVTLAALLLSSVFLSASASFAVPESDLSELFDPAAVRRNLCAGESRERVQLAAAPAPEAGARPALLTGFGSLSYPVTTKSRDAQIYFDQGLRLMYAFNHGEAVAAFRAAQEIDPTCAMCFWGESVALGPNINFEMSNRDHLRALVAIARANKLEAGATPRERALIDAAKQRYSADAKLTREQLDTAYTEAMAKVHAGYPDDPDIATLFAEAAMDSTHPWWTPGGRTAAGRMADAVTALEGVLHSHPDHPGAIHYYLHVMEPSAWVKVAEPYADKLPALMPGAGHIVHMPSHILFPLGRYKDTQAANLAAIAADEAYFPNATAFDANYFTLYAHNLHFGLHAAGMAGDGATALMLATKLAGALPDAALRDKFATQVNFAAALAARLRFDTPDAVLALPKPDADFAYLVAFWHYVQGSAFAFKGDIAKAQAEVDTLTAFRNGADIKVIGASHKMIPRILDVADAVLRARIASAGGRWSDAIAPLREAVAAEDEVGWAGDPPWWESPLRQSLGIALLRAGQTRDAVDTLRKALIAAPNDGTILAALREAALALGDQTAAAEYAKLLDNSWAGPKPPDLNRL